MKTRNTFYSSLSKKVVYAKLLYANKYIQLMNS